MLREFLRRGLHGTELFAKGLAHQRSGRLSEAEACYRKALKRAPEDPRVLHQLALILFADGRRTEAARLSGAAYELDRANGDYLELARHTYANAGVGDVPAALPEGSDAASLVTLGNALRQEGRFNDAEGAYRKAIDAAPANPFAHSRLANLLATQGRFAESTAGFEVARRAGLKPDSLVRLETEFITALRAGTRPVRPAPEGDWGATERALVVFMSCDQHYFDRFAYALVNSLKQNGRVDCHVHFHVVNPDGNLEARITGMRESLGFNGIASSHEHVGFVEGDNPRTYYACSRFLHLPALQRRYARPLLVVDMDMLVVRPLDGLMQSLAGCDAGLIEYDRVRNDVCEHFWASIVYCAASARGVEFFEDVALYIAHFLDARQPVWFLDQAALFAAYAHAREGTRLKMLAGGLCQTSMTPETGRLASDDPALFWSVTYSIPENAGKLELPEFLQYLDAAS